jgi:hypothetical protein
VLAKRQSRSRGPEIARAPRCVGATRARSPRPRSRCSTSACHRVPSAGAPPLLGDPGHDRRAPDPYHRPGPPPLPEATPPDSGYGHFPIVESRPREAQVRLLREQTDSRPRTVHGPKELAAGVGKLGSLELRGGVENLSDNLSENLSENLCENLSAGIIGVETSSLSVRLSPAGLAYSPTRPTRRFISEFQSAPSIFPFTFARKRFARRLRSADRRALKSK